MQAPLAQCMKRLCTSRPPAVTLTTFWSRIPLELLFQLYLAYLQPCFTDNRTLIWGRIFQGFPSTLFRNVRDRWRGQIVNLIGLTMSALHALPGWRNEVLHSSNEFALLERLDDRLIFDRLGARAPGREAEMHPPPEPAPPQKSTGPFPHDAKQCVHIWWIYRPLANSARWSHEVIHLMVHRLAMSCRDRPLGHSRQPQFPP